MQMHRRQRIEFGALIGFVLTVPLAAMFYAIHRRAGFPFVPFTIFDWETRLLPGTVLRAGIDSMVHGIRWLKVGSTSVTAKLAEQTIAVVEFVVAGIFVSTVFFVIARFFTRRLTDIAGVLTGGVLGVSAVLISRSVELTSAVSPVGRAFWIVLMFLAWGAALGWSYRRTVHDAPTGPLEVGALDSTGRRRFMIRLSGAAAIVSFIEGALGRVARNRGEASLASEEPWSARNQLPNVNVPVKPVLGTRPEFTPVGQHYRIDINTTPPGIEEAAWRLRITGLVGKPLVWTIDDIHARSPMHQFITLSCISNNIGGDLIGTTRWTGVSLKQLLPEFGLLRNATHLKIRSVDSFYEVVALDTIRADDRVMLTYAWDGLPLSAEHGFPLRIYIPDRYGMKQPKWIESIEAIDRWEPGFWVVRGWDSEARMKATSAIDTIATNMTIGQPNPQMRVPIGGFAHAGVRGVSRVEIRVDSGPWERAELRPPLSGQTWVIWRYDWPVQKGKHTFTVRCFEEDGTPQIQQEAPPDPSGASGVYMRSAMF